MQEVRVTPDAKAAATKLRAIVHGGLKQQVVDLQSQGHRLADGECWRGSKAAMFSGNVWPETNSALTKMIDALAELQVKVDAILEDIFAAGN